MLSRKNASARHFSAMHPRDASAPRHRLWATRAWLTRSAQQDKALRVCVMAAFVTVQALLVLGNV